MTVAAVSFHAIFIFLLPSLSFSLSLVLAMFGKSSAASGAEELGAPAAPAPSWAQKKNLQTQESRGSPVTFCLLLDHQGPLPLARSQLFLAVFFRTLVLEDWGSSTADLVPFDFEYL